MNSMSQRVCQVNASRPAEVQSPLVLMESVCEEIDPTYLACSGPDIVDVGSELASFVFQLCMDWQLVNEDLLIWKAATDEDNGPRVVAVLRPGPRGSNVVQWI